jgi:hypothetical protein
MPTRPPSFHSPIGAGSSADGAGGLKVLQEEKGMGRMGLEVIG